jgi:hypothetical protein
MTLSCYRTRYQKCGTRYKYYALSPSKGLLSADQRDPPRLLVEQNILHSFQQATIAIDNCRSEPRYGLIKHNIVSNCL